MVYRKRNFSRGLIDNVSPSNGDRFLNCNLSQLNIRDIFVGVKKLVFEKCNLINCIVPTGSKIIGCNTAKINYCSHINPDVRPLCSVNCEHVKENNTVKIDGVIAYHERNYEDKVIL